jgi:hypothetical protein
MLAEKLFGGWTPQVQLERGLDPPSRTSAAGLGSRRAEPRACVPNSEQIA